MRRKSTPVDRTLAQQIYEAYAGSDKSLAEIMELSGLDIDQASLSRKLRMKQKLWTDECEALATALGIVVTAGKAA